MLYSMSKGKHVNSMKNTLFHILIGFLLGCVITHNIWLKTGASVAKLKSFQIIPHHGPASPIFATIYDGDEVSVSVECKNKLYKARVR